MTTSTPVHTSPARTIEAAKMLMDWGKWLVTVQTAAIASLGFVTRTSDLSALLASNGSLAVTLGVFAVVSFVVSILHATYLLLFLPALVERIPDAAGVPATQTSLWHVKVPFAPGWQVGTFTANQTRFFVLGIVLFSAAYIALGFVSPK